MIKEILNKNQSSGLARVAEIYGNGIGFQHPQEEDLAPARFIMGMVERKLVKREKGETVLEHYERQAKLLFSDMVDAGIEGIDEASDKYKPDYPGCFADFARRCRTLCKMNEIIEEHFNNLMAGKRCFELKPEKAAEALYNAMKDRKKGLDPEISGRAFPAFISLFCSKYNNQEFVRPEAGDASLS